MNLKKAWNACLGGMMMGLAGIANAQWVQVDAPIDGATFAVGTPISLAASADGEGMVIQSVVFKQNGITISGDASAPYTATFTPGVAGTYELTATAMDRQFIVAESSAVTITVTGGANSLPTVSLTSPA